MSTEKSHKLLRQVIDLNPGNVINHPGSNVSFPIVSFKPVLVILAAGKGTRFGTDPKCIQPVAGIPLARHSVDAFRRSCDGPVICLVHYRQEEVMQALGDDITYVHSQNPTGGTAFAAYEAFCVPELLLQNPILMLTMGDRIVPESVFRRLLHIHTRSDAEADLTFLSARYQPPRHIGKGRIVRDAEGRIRKIVEQRDIDALSDPVQRRLLLDITEANCPLYAIRSNNLSHHLGALSNQNAQGQYYITDIVETIARDGGDVRTLTTAPDDPEYDLLSSDVTRPQDLALLEGVLCAVAPHVSRVRNEVEQAAQVICRDRPAGQIDAIAAQLHELIDMIDREQLGFEPEHPVAAGISGGRLRIAFMHPDMGRFYGPAWQMPIGAAAAEGREQILMLVQSARDGTIRLFPSGSEFREKLNALPADNAFMYPGDEITDWYSYEGFGTRLAEQLLMSLGYFSDQELQLRRESGLPLPPPSLWVCNGMRRPFSLIGNALASIRTLRNGHLGAKVQAALGRSRFQGMRIASSGNIPRGGFSSSSALTVAMKNAVNALYRLDIPPDLLVHLACQAEYGTGVRAGTLDQATEQKGVAGQGTLISSNPRENYRVLGVYPVPTQRFRVIFPYTIDRDNEAWQWSDGVYGESPGDPLPTTAEIRKLTGKSAEMAALLLRLPLDEDFFPRLGDDLAQNGLAGPATIRWVADCLLGLPLLISRTDLEVLLQAQRSWLIDQFIKKDALDRQTADAQAATTLESLMTGWREPVLQRSDGHGNIVRERGVPLRAMLAYLFGEVAKNYYLIHHPETWIESVTASQGGDRWFSIDPQNLPAADAMLGELPWEQGVRGPELLKLWLRHAGAVPVDFNRGLDDPSLSAETPMPLHKLEGGNFFRGLALIDLAEAMLKRAFGTDAVAVRVNAAGQGDYFQLHIDTEQVEPDIVKDFFRQAFYKRFDIHPLPAFVQPHTGGGAVGIRLSRFDRLPDLVRALESARHTTHHS